MLKKIAGLLFVFFLLALMVMMIVYVNLRFFLIIRYSYYWYDKILGFVLLAAEFFLLIHSFGYLVEVKRVFGKYKELQRDKFEVPKLETNPYVAVLVPSYHEPLDVLENTIIGCYNLTYQNKKIFLLDDTKYDEDDPQLVDYKNNLEKICEKYKINIFRREWRGAKAGMINDFVSFVTGKEDEDFQLLSFDPNKDSVLLKPKYFVVFDADQNPFPNFIEPLVSYAEKEDKISYIQTPQYYTNFETNRVANLAGMQQIVFYEYICSGKGIKDAMFCCGSNLLMRTDAIIDVGGFDETTVTEDAATSLKFHLKGWQSKYYNKVGVFGMGPEDLTNYFKQQFRWAMGAAELFKKVVINFFKNPRKLSLAKWWEYFLSTSFYFSSAVYLIMWIFPIMFLIFRTPSFFASPIIYGAIFIPYFILSISVFYWTLKKRYYKVSNVFKGQFLLWIAFPVIMKASIWGLIGRKKKFEITSKKGIETVSFFKLWPQITLAIACFVSVVWGLNRLFYERFLIFAILINIFWISYIFIVMCYIFYFNVPKTTMQKENQEK